MATPRSTLQIVAVLCKLYRVKPPAAELTNHEIVVYAAFVLGGDQKPVDTEDLATKVNQLAPGRFVWRKYPDQINLEIVRVTASNAKKPANGRLLRGSGREGWMLTQAGAAWARKHVARLAKTDLTRRRESNRDIRHRKAERARLLATEAYRKAKEGGVLSITDREAEAFFRVDPYVSPSKREERVLRIVNAFGRDRQLGAIVKVLAERVGGAGV
jgi:hypothetical protein